MSTNRVPEIFQPLGANGVYFVPNLDRAVPPPQFVRVARYHSLQPDEARQRAIYRMGHVVKSLLHSEGYIGRIIIYLPVCISPAIYDDRLAILRNNLFTAPRVLAVAIEMEDWQLCRHVAQDCLVPSCLQLVMNGLWKDSFARAGAACGFQTCWTALWHILVAKSCMFGSARILPALHLRFDTQLNVVIAELIRKCEATLHIGPDGYLPVDIFFDRYIASLGAQFVHNLNR